jgi:hypothetical protein
MAEEYKICLAGTSTAPVPGTENLKTMEQIEEWLFDNQVYYAENDPEKPVGEGSKYVVLPIDM